LRKAESGRPAQQAQSIDSLFGVTMGNRNLMPPGLSYLADNITTKHNLLGARKGEGSKWAKGLDLPAAAETIFFAGCGYQYASELEALMSLSRRMDKGGVADMAMGLAGIPKKIGIDPAGIYRRVMAKGGGDDAEVLRDAVKVLRKLDFSFGYLGEDEPCCGGLLYYIGLHEEFKTHAQEVCRQLKSRNVRQIVGIVPSCTFSLRDLVSKVADGYDIEVKHFTQVVAERLPSLSLRLPKPVKIAYHDPCQLVRYLGIVEEPRRILRAIQGVELVEPAWTKGDYATCCGGGGGFEAVFPEMSQILAVNRAKELLDTGADTIVTQCPGCIMQLKTGLKELKADKVEVLDLAQVVARAMRV
jgi:Fe-S oxidoreductase